MIGMNNYLSAYVDRRMKYIIEEWELSRKPDIADFSGRLEAIEREIIAVRANEKDISDKLTGLENRAKKLQEMI